MITPPKLLQTLKDVHPFQITGLALSLFNPPSQTSSPQNIKLASISAGNTVVMHTLPLSLVPKSSPPRYVISGSNDTSLITPGFVVSLICALSLAFFAQVALEVRGSSPALLNISHMVAPDVQGWIRVSHPIANGIFGTPKATITSTLSAVTVTSTVTTPSQAASSDTSFASVLDTLLSQQAEQSSQGGRKPVIVIREHPLDPSAEGETSTELKSSIKADLHDEAVHGPHDGKTWEELTKEERERWTQKLKEAGHWTEDCVETVLKGVFWGVAGAAVGAAAG
jgi:glycyl-tRNA synthetase